MFEFVPVPINIDCLRQLIPLWRTTLFLQLPNSAPAELSTVSVKCGIFQGDTLSPLLFCLALNPLSYLLDHLDGYRVSIDMCLMHLLYMDDLKLFARNDIDLQKLMNLVLTFSNAIRMSFGISKCAKLTMKRGRVVQPGPLPLADCLEIPEVGVSGVYRYLGFPEVGGMDHQHCKKVVLFEFEHRLRLIWGSLLYGHFKVQATNSFCVPLLSYGFGIVEWTAEELRRMDILARKVMREACS